jgi:predicted small integral membrane protein
MTSEQVDEYDEEIPAIRYLPLQPTSWYGWLLGVILIVWVFYVMACALFGMWRSFVWLKHLVLA